MSKQETVVVTAVTKAAKSLGTQVTAMAKAVAEIQALQAMVPELADEISMKTAALAQIEADTKETLRKAKAELNLQILENEDKVLETLMTKRNYAVITTGDLRELEESLADATSDVAATVAKAVAAKEAEVNRNFQFDIQKKESDHSVQTAELKATIKQLQNEVEFLKASNASLQENIVAERAARVEAAKYSQPIIKTGGQ